MALLDDVAEDQNPVSVTLDFSQFENGAKYSTLVREFYAAKASDYGAANPKQFVAKILLEALKKYIVQKEADLVTAKNVEAQAALEATSNTFAQQIESLVSGKESKQQDVKDLDLKDV
jgi:hypothetical protein